VTTAARDSLPSRQPGCPDERIGRTLAEHDSRRRRPVLVTGAHRSGTTWVGRMLDLSPEVGYINEPFNPHHAPGICACRFPLWFQYINRENEHLFRPHLTATLAFRYRPIAQLAGTRRPADAEPLLRDGLEFARARLRHARPVMKDPIAAFSSSWLSSTFGMATVVLVRHPAAFAASLVRLGWSHPFEDFLAQPALMEEQLQDFEGEITGMVKAKPDIIDQASLLWRLIYSVLLDYRAAHPGWIFVRQEDLARDPVRGFADLYRRLGLDYSQKIIDRVGWYSSGSREREADAAPYAIQRDSRRTISSWRWRLSKEQQSRLRAQVEELASDFYTASEW
jgi:Sulfotransferase family